MFETVELLCVAFMLLSSYAQGRKGKKSANKRKSYGRAAEQVVLCWSLHVKKDYGDGGPLLHRKHYKMQSNAPRTTQTRLHHHTQTLFEHGPTNGSKHLMLRASPDNSHQN